MLRDLSVLARPERLGAHVHVRIYAGPDRDHRAYCGACIFELEEWTVLAERLEQGADFEIEALR